MKKIKQLSFCISFLGRGCVSPCGAGCVFMLLIFLINGNRCFAQNVGIGGLPDASAKMDIQSVTQGTLIPRMSGAQRDSIHSPAEGLQIYNLDCHQLNIYNGTEWMDMLRNPAVPAPAAPSAGTNTALQAQIIWNWNAANRATGYKYSTSNSYAGATDNGADTSFSQSGLTCGGTSYTLYVWAYNGCGNSSATTLTQTTAPCGPCAGLTTTTDSRDGQVYNIVSIGSQCWFAQNLNYGTYEIYPGSGAQPSGYKYCQNLGDGDDPSCPMGGLYDWANMMNGFGGCDGTGAAQPACSSPVQGLCPAGWHIPSHYEFTLLERTVAGSDSASFPYDESLTGPLGITEGGAMKVIPVCGTLPCWNSPNTGATDITGFSALAGGYSGYGSLNDAGVYGHFWTTTEGGVGAWNHVLFHDQSTVDRNPDYEDLGFSVRCVKN